ncbi:cytochrome c3 family protein [Desulfobacula sp.]|uniref:cytochrome c3 family protein n=1 Tax=Desulfobacula sp. TaxID=2593537 RepID=UPI00261DAD0F|nr:cytochrome c3 family protein [Desulfobacula sp.]
MNKKLLTLLLVAGIAVIFVATGLNAGTEVKDNLILEDPGYKKPKKRAPKFKSLAFTHKKHMEDHKISCGECHHDKDNKPLDLKIGDNVQKCSECHNKFKKDKKNRKDIMVHENAMHGNCVTCHKDINKKAGDKKGMKGPAPASCTKCHISTKKKK